METPIKNVEDLNKKGGTEGGIKYGCVTDQSTASFFQVNIFRLLKILLNNECSLRFYKYKI